MRSDEAPVTDTTPGELEQASLAELVRRLSEQTSQLARQEVALAKAEVTEKGKQIGVGAGAFGAAGLVGLYALGALIAAAILALATAVDGWLAALIVAVVLGLVAGVLALTGKQRVQRASPPVPERALDSTKHDIEAAKTAAKEGRDG
jgi:MFS family permease